MFFMKTKVMLFALLLVVGVGFAGCRGTGQPASSSKTNSSSGESAETVLKTALTGLFSTPDKEMAEVLRQSSTLVGSGVPKQASGSSNPTDTIIQKRYGRIFTEQGLVSFTAQYLSTYQGFAATNQWKMSVDEIKATGTTTGYDFTARVKYGKKQQDKTAPISGDAQFTNGKLSSFRISSDNGLLDVLRNAG